MTTVVVAVVAPTTALWHHWLYLAHVATTVATACKRVAMMAPHHCWSSPACAVTTMALGHERVAMMLPQQCQLPLACAATLTAAVRERVEAMAPIFPCSLCDDDDGGGIVKDSALVLLIVLLLSNNNGGVSADNGAFLLLVIPCSREQEGSMIRGNVTASWHVTRGSGMRRADARQRQRNKRQHNNQLVHQ
jgi:hypothetical protein